MATPPSQPPKTAIAYLRVSTDEQADRGFGLDVQRKRVEEFCSREKLDLVAVFKDPGVPGTTPLPERPGLSAAFRMVASCEADALVVARYDRLARDTLQALLIEREFRQAGKTVLYVDGPNGGEEFQFLREVMHAVAAEQRRQIVGRLRAGREAKAAKGGYAGGRPPFGYKAEEGQLVPDSDEAEVVRWIFRRVADDRWSIRRVASGLNEEQTLGRSWRATDVARILKRDLYKRGSEKVVDPKVWNRAQARLREKRKR